MTKEIAGIWLLIGSLAFLGFWLTYRSKQLKPTTPEQITGKNGTLYLVYNENGDRVYASVKKAYATYPNRCFVSVVPYANVEFHEGKKPEITIHENIEVKVITKNGAEFP